MSDLPTRFRSPHLLDRSNTALVVVDIQEKLIPVIDGGERVIVESKRLADAAEILGVPVLISEQYPQGLGKTVGNFSPDAVAVVAEKKMFSCRECDSMFEFLQSSSVESVLLCGIEAHVCVAQTAFDLLASGFRVHVAADAVGSRKAKDYDAAIARMQMHGIAITTAEAAILELCETAAAAEFKQISALIK